MSRLSRWLPVVVWAAFISFLSTRSFGSDHTAPVVFSMLRWIFPHASDTTLELIHHLIRKSAHFTEYFIFSLLLLRAIRGPEHGWEFRWAILALAIAAAYSGFDEFHQIFVPGRQASPWDSLLDTVGAATAQVVAWMALYRAKRDAGQKQSDAER